MVVRLRPDSKEAYLLFGGEIIWIFTCTDEFKLIEEQIEGVSRRWSFALFITSTRKL